MAFRRDPDAGRKAITWLAVSFTLTTGVLVCSFIILAFAENQPRGFLVLGAVMDGLSVRAELNGGSDVSDPELLDSVLDILLNGMRVRDGKEK